MARKDLNVFNISFLDLLSGALAAVIILFIIVPKLNANADQAAEKMQQLDSETEQLDSAIQAALKMIPDAQSEIVEEHMKQLRNTLMEVKEKVKDLEEAQNQITKQNLENEKYRNWMEQCDLKLSDNCPNPNPVPQDCPPSFQEYKDWMDSCGLLLDDECPVASNINKAVSVGFEFKGSNIVFIIDASASMGPNYNDYGEERLASVKAGLKMLIASMTDQFRIDVVHFPYLGNDDYRANWGHLRSATETNKKDINLFLYGLKPSAATPTRAVLGHVLTNYKGLTDIVLLTDGEPTREGYLDDVYDIVEMVDQMNITNVQINTIGVGSDFFDNPSADKVIFLKQLSARNGNGFFIEF